LERKQVFAAALKRVNKEIGRMRKLDARTAHIEAARRALDLRRAAQFPSHPRLATWPTTACVRSQVNVGEQEFLLPESAGYPRPRRMRKPLGTPATADKALKLGYRSHTGRYTVHGGSHFGRCPSSVASVLAPLQTKAAAPAHCR
jgi:hypothetical protein